MRPGAECLARGGAEASDPPGATHVGEAPSSRGGQGGMGCFFFWGVGFMTDDGLYTSLSLSDIMIKRLCFFGRA